MSTPMMRQYLDIKSQHPDSILFFRMGDFYEMFFEDALTASKELGLTLTSRSKGNESKAPMAGVPHHAAEQYISQLIEKGYRVALCEQVEDPKEAKGLVAREVVRIISPGTIVEENLLEQKENNYLLAITKAAESYGLAYVDISTGEIGVTEIKENNFSLFLGEINRLQPKEILTDKQFKASPFYREFMENLDWAPLLTDTDNNFDFYTAKEKIKTFFQVFNLESFSLEEQEGGTIATAILCHFLFESQKNPLNYIKKILYYSVDDYMVLDGHTRRNLELNRRIIQGTRQGSLADILDETKTAMGARLLKKWVNQPLLNIDTINSRLDTVEELLEKDTARESLSELLKDIHDLERLIGRVGYGNANARDLLSLKESLEKLPDIKKHLSNFSKISYLYRSGELDELQDLYKLLVESIKENPPVSITEGDIIKPGYQSDLESLKTRIEDNKNWIANLESAEKARTGIKSLKIGFNKIFGYYIEVTRTNLALVPDEYIRKQTLANAERYFTNELKEKEDLILSAEERINTLEYNIFLDIRSKVNEEAHRIQQVAGILAELDVFISLSLVALAKNYSRPLVNNSKVLSITNGRHPVVESIIGIGKFVANNTLMDNEKKRFHIITGPNMAGKSTYLRQVALIVLMAQMGSYVPADLAEIGIVDRIFTRIGATDDLAKGKSTFLVEMTEVAQIINAATANSLILLDEVGRGTSTFDGLSIAWAVVEHINNPLKIGAKTLFATHYHELIALEKSNKGIVNYNVAVEKKGEEIVFLHVIKPGGADESYGINVARLAGIPLEVIYRSKEILLSLENTEQVKKKQPVKKPLFPMFDKSGAENLLRSIRDLDLLNSTPLEMMNFLYAQQKQVIEYFAKEENNE